MGILLLAKHSMPSRRKIGLLGGSFNPAHAGHLHISLYALKTLKLDEVWWLVSPQNPLKPVQDMAAFATRLAHAKILARHPKIKVLDIENTLGTRYTYDTLQALIKRHPRLGFTWLMGADNLAQFHRWHRWRDIMNMVPIAVFDRAPFSHRALKQPTSLSYARCRLPESKALLLPDKQPPVWAFIFMRRHAASATGIRKLFGKKAFLAHNERA